MLLNHLTRVRRAKNICRGLDQSLKIRYAAQPTTFSVLRRHGKVSGLREDSQSKASAQSTITLCVEGNISVGKSTFLKQILGADDNPLKGFLHLVPEPVESWQHVTKKNIGEHADFNILEEFYQNPARYAYSFQQFVFMTRFLQYENTKDASSPIRVIERSVFSDRNVFTEALYDNSWLSDLEYSLYHAWFDPFIESFPALVPDGFVYLRAQPDICLRRMHQRARGEECDVNVEYLTSLHRKHDSWLLSKLSDKESIGRDIFTCTVDIQTSGKIIEVPVLVINFDHDLTVEVHSARVRELQLCILNFVRSLQNK